MMDPELQALSEKYSEKLVFDPMFSFRVKTIYKFMRRIAPERDEHKSKAEAYLLACVLEESHV